MNRELLQQELDAMRQCEHTTPTTQAAITALSAALDAEPVGYVYSDSSGPVTTKHGAIQTNRDLPNGTPLYAAPPTPATFAQGYAEGFSDACRPAQPAVREATDKESFVVREPLIDEMDAVAVKYAHKMALDLECVLSNYIGPWYDTAMQTLSEYRMAMNAIHERESPTHMGEPDVRNRISGDGK